MGSRQIVLWSKERDQIITENRGKLSAYLIAELIGGGCTRSAVIGRSRRLGLETLKKTDPDKNIRRRGHILRNSTRNYQTKPRVKKVKLPPAAPVVDTQIPFEQRKQLLELNDGDCRWPVGEPAAPDFFFCGAHSLDGHPYCTAHMWRSRARDERSGTRFVFRRAA